MKNTGDIQDSNKSLQEFSFTGTIMKPEGCDWHFIVVPNELAKDIRELYKWKEEGWGRMKALIKIGKSSWKTSIWFDTKNDTYWFPVKADIRNKEKLEIGDSTQVTLCL